MKKDVRKLLHELSKTANRHRLGKLWREGARGTSHPIRGHGDHTWVPGDGLKKRVRSIETA